MTALKASEEATIRADSPAGGRGHVHERAEMDAGDRREPDAASLLGALEDDVEDGRPRDQQQRQSRQAEEPHRGRSPERPRVPFWPVRRYHVTTFGCQMNAHDSERIKGMLEELGLGEATTQDEADVLVFNTCTIREKPDQKFAAHLAQAAALKRRDPDKVIAVGGCYAEAQRERLFELYPYVDVAFGPGSIPHLGEWLGAGGLGVARGRFGLDDRSFAGELPMHRERSFQAWVQISMGCNSKCAYCIVPAVRGREVSRRPGDILAEVTRLAAKVCESSRCSARTSTRGAATSRRTSTRSSASCCAPATRSTGSSAFASRARIRRTSAGR